MGPAGDPEKDIEYIENATKAALNDEPDYLRINKYISAVERKVVKIVKLLSRDYWRIWTGNCKSPLK